MKEIWFWNLKKMFFMKNNNEKLMKLMSNGFNPSFVFSLSENQVNSLYKRIINEQSQTAQPKITTKQVKQIELQPNSETNLNGMTVSTKNGKTVITQTNQGEVTEKFESKSQQGLFWAKCNNSKGKEKQKWCKMAKEFSDKTSKKDYEKMPYKKETKESGYMDLIGNTYAKSMSNKTSEMKPSFSFNQLEESLSNIIEKHTHPKMTKEELLSTIFNLMKESPEVKPASPEVLPKPKEREAEPSTPFEDDPLRPGRRTRPRPAPQADFDDEEEFGTSKFDGLDDEETDFDEEEFGFDFENEFEDDDEDFGFAKHSGDFDGDDSEFEDDEEDFGFAKHSGDFDDDDSEFEDDEELNEDDYSWMDNIDEE